MAVHTAAPAGVGKPSEVSLAASARSDSEPSGSSRVMIGASDAAWPRALAVCALRALAVSSAVPARPRKPPSFLPRTLAAASDPGRATPLARHGDRAREAASDRNRLLKGTPGGSPIRQALNLPPLPTGLP